MTIPNPASFSEIAAEFGLPATFRFPTDVYGRVGAPSSGPLNVSFFYGKTAPPTTAPVVTQSPTIDPTTGRAGQTVYTATDGMSDAGAPASVAWLLDGQVVGSGPQFAPNASQNGSLVRRNVFTNSGGLSTIASSAAATVTPSVTFTPDGGAYEAEEPDQVTYNIYCSEPATWTYNRSNNIGVTNINSGQRSGFISMTVTAGGTGTGKFDRTCRWTVRGVSDSGVIRDFDVNLIARGNQ